MLLNEVLYIGYYIIWEDNMELKKDTTETKETTGDAEEIIDINDRIFGNIGQDEAYIISDTYINNNNKKSGIVAWIFAGCAIAIALVIGGIFLVSYLREKAINGTYEITEVEVFGQKYAVEDLEAATGMEFYMSLRIDGEKGYLIMDYGNMKEEGDVTIEIDGKDITVKGVGGKLTFKYNPSDKTITYDNSGASIKFKKIK